MLELSVKEWVAKKYEESKGRARPVRVKRLIRKAQIILATEYHQNFYLNGIRSKCGHAPYFVNSRQSDNFYKLTHEYWDRQLPELFYHLRERVSVDQLGNIFFRQIILLLTWNHD